MKLRCHTSAIPADMAAALSDFEREFTYPLGKDCRFRISHGDDYLGFFRAMGEATLATTEHNGEITGCLGRVEKVLELWNDGRRREIPTHYLCDLKVRPAYRGSLVLPRLIRETKRLIEADESHACFGVTMTGTENVPAGSYTGRLGVPQFEKLGDITVLRLSARFPAGGEMTSRVVSVAEFAVARAAMAGCGYRSAVRGRPSRSRMTPLPVISAAADACGVLEDTREVKRLFRDTGEELVSAHLTSFCYGSPQAAGVLLRDVVDLAGAAGCPAVFTAVPSGRMDELRPFLVGMEVTEAPAMVHGIGLERGMEWWMDTAEI